jgi:hypothetical protein
MDSLSADGGVVPGAELDLAARSVIDSVYIEDVPRDTVAASEDSLYVITKDRELRLLKYDFPDSLIYDPTTGKYAAETPKYTVTEVRFNVEQDNYMWYLRDYLVLPDVRLAHINQGNDGGNGKAGSAKKEKKGFFGFFKGLFKKKKKEAPVDSAALKAPVKSEHDFDYVDEDEQLKAQQAQQQASPKKEKKGPFSFLKKKDKGSTPPAEKKKKEKKEKEKKPKEEAPPVVDEKEKKADDEGGF